GVDSGYRRRRRVRRDEAGRARHVRHRELVDAAAHSELIEPTGLVANDEGTVRGADDTTALQRVRLDRALCLLRAVKVDMDTCRAALAIVGRGYGMPFIVCDIGAAVDADVVRAE